MHPKLFKLLTLPLFSGGTSSSKSTCTDSKKGSSFAAESEAIIEVGEQKKEEDAGSIKSEEGLEMKIITWTEMADVLKAKDIEEYNVTQEFRTIRNPTIEEAKESHV